MSLVVHLLDYGAGNVRSVRNAIEKVGFSVSLVSTPADLANVTSLVFPGVGSFGAAIDFLDARGFRAPLLDFIASGRPFLGVCLGMQTLFETSAESPDARGLGVIPGTVSRLAPVDGSSVPHIGWNATSLQQSVDAAPAIAALGSKDARVYFVHSFAARVTAANAGWVATTTDYGGERFISSVARGNVYASQFHPEKSGELGLRIFGDFFASASRAPLCPLVSQLPVQDARAAEIQTTGERTRVARRIVACLDVRSNDAGDLVVTKGDQYDVRESVSAGASGGDKGAVRNLGKPVDLCARYYAEGADEVVFLNITAFRAEPLGDEPMLRVLEAASERVFVPLTVGGGIRSYTDSAGVAYTALDVAARYFRAGADKISIGSDAVFAAEDFFARGARADGSSTLEQIAHVYGRQAVVVSVDPRRVWVTEGAEADAACAVGHVLLSPPRGARGPRGETRCWYQATVKGGREGRPICAVRLAIASEACVLPFRPAPFVGEGRKCTHNDRLTPNLSLPHIYYVYFRLGAGELLVNSVDADGSGAGFDDALLGAVTKAVTIPVIASSGAGCAAHFTDIFAATRVEAALAAGIFHRKEVPISDVKRAVALSGIPIRA